MIFIDTLKKFAAGLAKTRDSIVGKVQHLVNAKRTIDEEVLERLEEALISADVGTETTSKIVGNIRQRVKEDKYETPGDLQALLRDETAKLLQSNLNGLGVSAGTALPLDPRPFVIMVVGVNGVGKTTTIGKLAYNYKQAGYTVMIGAADTFRAAANEQLEIWAKRAGVDLVRQATGADPGAVAFDALSSAIASKTDVVIIDTAGRLHTKVNLMEELRKIKRVLGRRMPGAPHEVLLVLDASTGQNGLQQAKQFSAAVDVTGLVLTKLDGTAKGGIVLAVCDLVKIPVQYIGVGEQIDDLQPFDRNAFVQALFGEPV